MVLVLVLALVLLLALALVLVLNFELKHNTTSSSIKTEAASFAYTKATIHQSKRRHNQEDWYLHKLTF